MLIMTTMTTALPSSFVRRLRVAVAGVHARAARAMVVQGDEAEEATRAIETVVRHQQIAGGVVLVVEQAEGVGAQATGCTAGATTSANERDTANGKVM
jgi:hypothetical protein